MRMAGMRGQWAKSPKEAKRLEEAGLSDDVIDDALAAFILEVALFNFLDGVHVLIKNKHNCLTWYAV